MDKIKDILAVVKKQHFWVMSGLVLVVGLAGWAMATSQLMAEYKTNRGKIEAEFKELAQLSGEERPNQDWIDGVDKQTAELKAKVKTAWEDVYAEQRDKVLKWPAVLGEEFLAIVPKLAPNEEIPMDQRATYWNYVKEEEFSKLLAIIDARSYREKPDPQADNRPKLGAARGPGARPPGAGGKPAGAADKEAEPERDYKVIWDPHNQAVIDQRLEWNKLPDTREVRQTQEDLWVYQSLLTIISHLNDRADGHHNAKVKELRSLLIGQEAAPEFQAGMAEGRVERPEPPTGGQGGAAPLSGSATSPPPLATQKSAPPLGTPPSESASAPSPDEGRYVGEKGVSLAAGAPAPAEFKRMPVFLQLLLDQREISRLLVECANSPLPVEVRQLRVTPAKAKANSTRRAAPTRGGALGGGRPAQPGMAGGHGHMGADDERDESPYDVVVELHGIVYIFNPPDQTKLSLPVAPGDAPAGDAAPTDVAPDEAAGKDPSAPAADDKTTPDDEAAAASDTAPSDAGEAAAADGAAAETEDTASEAEEASAKSDGEMPDEGR